MESLSRSVRLRLRDEMTRKRLSQRDLAGLLEWSQSRVAHLLTGRVTMTVDDLSALAFAVSLSPLELVRDQGFRVCGGPHAERAADSPGGAGLPEKDREAFLRVLRISVTISTAP